MHYRRNLKSIKHKKKNWYKVFSCFSCWGGSSMWYKLASYEVIGNCEIDPKMNNIYRKNINPKYSYCEDIRDFRKRKTLPKELYNLDILDWSPPCSLFSTSNTWADEKKWKEIKFKEWQKKQVLDDLFFEFIALVERLQPKVVIAENVMGLLQEKNSKYVNRIYEWLRTVWYKVFYHILNSKTMWVPQSRKRVFFIAIRNDIPIATDDLFSNKPRIEFDFNELPIRMKDIEQDNMGKDITEHERRILEHYQDWDKTLWNIRKRIDGKDTWFNQILLKEEDVCPTLRAGSNDFIKIKQKKKLSDYELMQIWSRPLDYDFDNVQPIYAIWMSVPPLMMYKIAKEIEKQVLNTTVSLF